MRVPRDTALIKHAHNHVKHGQRKNNLQWAGFTYVPTSIPQSAARTRDLMLGSRLTERTGWPGSLLGHLSLVLLHTQQTLPASLHPGNSSYPGTTLKKDQTFLPEWHPREPFWAADSFQQSPCAVRSHLRLCPDRADHSHTALHGSIPLTQLKSSFNSMSNCPENWQMWRSLACLLFIVFSSMPFFISSISAWQPVAELTS